jgi:uncharacterized protein YeaO (DUF488 family)
MVGAGKAEGTSVIRIKRIYAQPEPIDGYRVLLDRLWPRGIKKEDARLDEWLKVIAPSNDLRKWFNHDPARWETFVEQYRSELEAPASSGELERLRVFAEGGTLTLLYAARSEIENNAVVIRNLLVGSEQ